MTEPNKEAVEAAAREVAKAFNTKEWAGFKYMAARVITAALPFLDRRAPSQSDEAVEEEDIDDAQ